MNDARETILARIRSTDAGAEPDLVRSYRVRGELDDYAITRLFCERVADYRAEVLRVARRDVVTTIAGTCAALRLVVPPHWQDIPSPPGVELIRDANHSPRDLDALDGVLTGCTLAIAETGSIVLTGGPSEGRRALTLVPDLHVCLVDAAQIVETVPEAIRRLGSLVRAERRPVTLVSGPSATSDIELSRVEGVHGPRNLRVIVYE